MMTKPRKRLPVGVDRFEKIRSLDYYYLDKTLFIKELLDSLGEVNLFTRPRRFGKTLNMSMLKAFFEIGSDPALFAGTKIEKETALCEAHQGKYPVVFLSLKSVEGATYEDALQKLAYLVSVECIRLTYLTKGSADESDKQAFQRLLDRTASEAELTAALVTLMRMLHAHYGKQVILLIDEYDVPLDKANLNGYYNRMVTFLRGFFGEAFKTNPDLYFAVVTGCLRISKESIFTGVNNLKVDTIQDERYDEYFGFTNEDVRKILADYNLSDAYDAMREWYDGYHFGATDVYCPWDVVCHCDKLLENPNAEPQPYWNNTSSNALVRQFVEKADATTRSDIERLIAGEVIERKLISTLTYEEVSQKIEHLWSVLYLTGYLTTDSRQKPSQRGYARFVIPNREVREIFIEKIQGWFEETTVPACRASLCSAVCDCDTAALQEQLRNILLDTISYHDYHENYYHALLVGLLLDANWRVISNKGERSEPEGLDARGTRASSFGYAKIACTNCICACDPGVEDTAEGSTAEPKPATFGARAANREMGVGRSDIVIEDHRNRRAFIIETKRAASYEALEQASADGVKQIVEKQYAAPYLRRKYQVIAYGIAFFEKDCSVSAERLDSSGASA